MVGAAAARVAIGPTTIIRSSLLTAAVLIFPPSGTSGITVFPPAATASTPNGNVVASSDMMGSLGAGAPAAGLLPLGAALGYPGTNSGVSIDALSSAPTAPATAV